MKLYFLVVILVLLASCAWIKGPCEAGQGTARCQTGGELVIWGSK